MTVVDVEVVLGGTLTGSIIGLLWNPAAAVAALVVATAMAFLAREWPQKSRTR